MLNDAQIAEAWEVLKDTPLAKTWTELKSDYLWRCDRIEVQAGAVLMQPTDPPADFYIVGAGRARGRLYREDRPWFAWDLKAGHCFGQAALYFNLPQIEVVAVEPTVFYRLRLSDLRSAIEHNEKLYEFLLHQDLAGRLRRLPVLRTVDNTTILQIAALVEVVDLAAERDVDLSQAGSFYVIEYGQVAVTGPAAFGLPEWRLTAGNFFMAPGATPRPGQNCTADTARTRYPSRLLRFPAGLYNALADTFPDIAQLTRRPLDIRDHLPYNGAFHGLSREQRAHLAQFCGWMFVPAGQNITTQGQPGHGLVILRQGTAVRSAVDPQGRQRPRDILHAPAVYGETSLFEGKEHEATVRAVTTAATASQDRLDGADIIVLDRRDLDVAFQENPQLWGADVPLKQRTTQIKQEARPFDWMQDGEKLEWKGRPHWLWLAGPLAGVGLIGLALWTVTALAPAENRDELTIFSLFASVFALLPVALFALINYLDDYYVITNRRVTRRDRLLLLYEARTETPLDMIQDVTYDATFWGRVFDYGDVIIRSAARVGSITFAHVPHPEKVQAQIKRGQAEATAGTRGMRHEELRKAVMADLRLALPIPAVGRALGPDAQAPVRRAWWQWWRRQESSRKLPAMKGTLPGPFVRLANRLPDPWRRLLIGGPAQELQIGTGEFLWRKHPIQLIIQASRPFVLLLIWLVFGWILFRTELGANRVALHLPWWFLFIFFLSWIIWEFADYQNDLYILKEDRIIDIEATPLWLSIKRREGSLDRVQNVLARQEGIWQNLLGYGDVIIQTAAQDEGFTFKNVSNPQYVQALIFQKLDAFKVRQAERQVRERQREIIEGLSVYHELRSEGHNL